MSDCPVFRKRSKADAFMRERIERRFSDVWKARNSIRPAIAVDSMEDWAKGRKHYLTFLIRVREEKLIEKIADIQDRLSTIPCVDPFPEEYLHITVKGCGFPVESKTYEDDIQRADARRIADQARAILQAYHRFSVRLPRLNVFSEVVLVEVHDEGGIGELNKGLQVIPETRKMKFDYPILLPHISIAQFRSNQGFDRLIRALGKMRAADFGELRVDKIDLVDAYLPGKYPTLKTIETFELR